MNQSTEHHDALSTRVVETVTTLTGIVVAVEQWKKDIGDLKASIDKLDSQVANDAERSTSTKTAVSSFSQVCVYSHG
jgi:hypothetical protein